MMICGDYSLKDAGKFEDYTADVRHTYIEIMNKT